MCRISCGDDSVTQSHAILITTMLGDLFQTFARAERSTGFLSRFLGFLLCTANNKFIWQRLFLQLFMCVKSPCDHYKIRACHLQIRQSQLG